MDTFLIDTIREAGQICVAEQPGMNPDRVAFKNPKDLVTEVDRKVEDFIISRIMNQHPDHDIFGEETGQTSTGSEYLWIIDPIDGTTSYFHGQPFYSVSIALQQNGSPLLGAVYLPATDELFFARKEKGATLNGKPIHVSTTDRLIQSVMATGFACLRAGLEQNNLAYLNRLLPDLRDIRRCGSAAMDLCYVACGRFDGFWEMCLNLYDVAAGALIVEEASGIVCDFNGGPDYPEQGMIAVNPDLAEPLLKYFQGQ